MRPVLPKKHLSYKLWIIYALIFLMCVLGIALALYRTQYFQEENVGRALGIIDKDSEKEDQYNDLKAEFNTIFTNQVENLQNTNVNVEKINNDYDIVVTAYNYKEDKENITIDVAIPYINVQHDSARLFNKQISKNYKNRAETLKNQISSLSIIYSVQYKAYIQNNILSLAIRSEYKEGNKSQRISVETFNYNLVEKREVSINEILNLKNITANDATKRVKDEIKKIQEQNQPLIDQGYSFYQRDYNSSEYEVSNCKQFLYGKNGMLYLVYPYGNKEDTSEMDVVIFE